jgi:flagellar biosynthesis component FlhA
LLDQASIDALDATYAGVLAKIEALSPSKVIASTLDPLYEQLLSTIVPVLEMPARLRALVDIAARDLGDELLSELVRVEEAFDRMLQAIPLDGGGSGASGSVGISARASAG